MELWKKYPYWLKGGIISAGFIFIIFLLSFILLHLGCMSRIIFLLSQKPEIMFPTPCLVVYFFYTYWAINLPCFFILGAGMGRIIEKIRSKK